MFGAGLVEHRTLDDGRVEATIGERTPTALAGQVAGFGREVELVDPPAEVVAELRRIAAELADEWLDNHE